MKKFYLLLLFTLLTANNLKSAVQFSPTSSLIEFDKESINLGPDITIQTKGSHPLDFYFPSQGANVDLGILGKILKILSSAKGPLGEWAQKKYAQKLEQAKDFRLQELISSGEISISAPTEKITRDFNKDELEIIQRTNDGLGEILEGFTNLDSSIELETKLS